VATSSAAPSAATTTPIARTATSPGSTGIPAKTPTDLLAFTKRLIKLRQSYPALRRSRFLTGQYDDALGIKDVTWINANGHEMQDANWKDASMRCFGMLLDGRAQKTGIKRRGQDKTVLMVMNSYQGLVDFTFPKSEGGEAWTLLVDTNIPDATFQRPNSSSAVSIRSPAGRCCCSPSRRRSDRGFRAALD
jgi:pullulanase/glycogen debranching enzyme